MPKGDQTTSTLTNSQCLLTARRKKGEILATFDSIPDVVSEEEVKATLKELPILQVIKDDILQKKAKKLVGRFVTQDSSIGELMVFETIQSIAACNAVGRALTKVLLENSELALTEEYVALANMFNAVENTKLRMTQATVDFAEKLQALTTKKAPETTPKHLPPTFATQVVVNTQKPESVEVKAVEVPEP